MTETQRRRLWVPRGRAKAAVAVVGVLSLLGALAWLTVEWVTRLPDDAVLRVHDTVVTQEEFQQRLTVLEALYGVQPPEDGPDLDRFNGDAAKSVAVSLILDDAARERDIVVAGKTAQDALERLIRDQMPEGRDAFIEFLGSQGISEREVRDEVTRQMRSARLFDAVTESVPQVTDDDVREAYADREAQMVTPERRHLRNIVVETKSQAENIAANARDGADFAKLARDQSMDAATKDKGGDLGTLTADRLDPAFSKVAFAAPKGAVFGPVQSQYGWNVGRVVGIKPGTPLSFEQVADQLKETLQSERKLDTWRSWLAQQIEDAETEYADDYRPIDPDAPPSDTQQIPAPR